MAAMATTSAALLAVDVFNMVFRRWLETAVVGMEYRL
jgi:hypothetical protein